MKALDDAQLAQALAALPDWSLDQGKLYRRLIFDDFVDAFAFMSGAALLAERANHHPEWFNVYNRLDLWLVSHDVAAISDRDIALAQELDALHARRRQAGGGERTDG